MTHARRDGEIPNRIGKKTYLFVLAGAGIGAFVEVVLLGVDVELSPPQPVSTAPANRLNRTKTMYILFIVR